MRTTTLTAAGLLGLTLLAPTSAATAAGETCRGEAATIVGTSGRDIIGTDGRDVVVTNRSGEVDTLGGDDLVCITGPNRPKGTQSQVQLDTGAGNDLVDGTAAPDWAVSGYLGSGADTFYGGGADDFIEAGEAGDDYSHLDSERDILSGGGGRDHFVSGQAGVPNNDYVRLGQGHDYLSHLGTSPDPISISGGPGTDLLSLTPSALSITIDNAQGRLTQDGRPTLGWSDLEGFSVYAPDQEGAAVTFVGTDEDEHLTIDSASATVAASFDGGRDSLTTRSLLLDGSAVDGGAGRDLLYLVDRDRTLRLDLRDELLTSTDAVATHRVDVRRVEDAQLHARVAELAGTSGPNELSTSACAGTIRGRGGNDVLVRGSEAWSESSPPCRAERYTIDGDQGADVLRGWRGNDVLVGGAGRDDADGGNGRDRCVAEHERRCER